MSVDEEVVGNQEGGGELEKGEEDALDTSCSLPLSISYTTTNLFRSYLSSRIGRYCFGSVLVSFELRSLTGIANLPGVP